MPSGDRGMSGLHSVITLDAKGTDLVQGCLSARLDVLEEYGGGV